MYSFTIKHIPGERNQAADAISRYPTKNSSPDDADNITKAAVNAVRYRYDNDAVLRAITWDRIRATAAVDAEFIALIETLHQGFPPDRNAVPDQIKCRCVNHCTKLTAYLSATTKC